MTTEVNRDQISRFFQGGSIESLVVRLAEDRGDGHPGPDFRQNRIAEQAKVIFADALGEALADSAWYAHGYDFRGEADREEFIEAIKAGAALAIIAFGGATENEDFFKALDAEPEVM